MKILIRQFLGKLHSWSLFGWSIAQSLKLLGHEVDLFSTDGIEHLPPDLKENLIGYTLENQSQVFGRLPDVKKYDTLISYTSIKNFNFYLNGGKNRFGTWVFEWKNGFPTGFAKNYKYCDYLCSPSEFGKQVFMEAGIPEQIIKVIPHGIHAKDYRQTSTMNLFTKKKFKILVTLAQNHIRKNIPGMLEAYGKAFTKKDDVCLIIKGKFKPVKMQFDISLKECLDNFYFKYPNHAEVKVETNFIEDMSILYRSVDATYTMSFCEGFYFPAAESIASGKIAIAPNWGGQLDFLNENNSLLVNGKEENADPKSMYWESKPGAIWFRPSIDDAVEKLRYAYNNYETLNKKVEEQREDFFQKYDWSNISKQFMDLCK